MDFLKILPSLDHDCSYSATLPKLHSTPHLKQAWDVFDMYIHTFFQGVFGVYRSVWDVMDLRTFLLK